MGKIKEAVHDVWMFFVETTVLYLLVFWIFLVWIIGGPEVLDD